MPATSSHGPRVCDRFTLLEKLGSGGRGEVWRARDEALGIDVALKVLGAAVSEGSRAWEALEREHALASRLDHPLILKVHAPLRDAQLAVLPMELAAGGDLRRLRGASYLQIVPVLIDLARALLHAHERGVVHRDLKPGNILFDDHGQLRVADFGAASLLRSSEGGSELRASREFSPFTASPQQLRGEPASTSDDVYGLGALAFELLTGYPPYYPQFELARRLEGEVPELHVAHQAPPRLIGLVRALLAKSAGERPASMQDVIASLEAALDDTLTFDGAQTADGGAAAPVTSKESAGASNPAVPDPPGWDEAFRGIDPPPLRVRTERGERRRVAPWLAVAGLAGAAVASFYWLPAHMPASFAAAPGASPVGAAPRDPAAEERLRRARAEFDARLAALDARGAGVWGGAAYASAKTHAAEAAGADDAGSPAIAEERLAEASRLLGSVEQRAAQAMSDEIAAGDRALQASNVAAASQAFALALRIDPRDARALAGARRTRALTAQLPLLANAANAELEHDYAHAVQSYSQALALDASNVTAGAGLARARAALGADSYAKAIGTGFAALGAGQLEDARAAFLRARTLQPTGTEATRGLVRVDAAQRAREFAQLQQHAAALEAQERWSEARHEYEAALKRDPSLAFAQQGLARATYRETLARRLQALADAPQRLGSPSVREEAVALIHRANQQQPAGPVLRSQAERLASLLPAFDKPVHLALESDNATVVAIPQVGTLGTFSRREIDLRPGRYTFVGTRNGYRDVRRDVTVTPGDRVQTISVRCVEPI